MKNKKIKIKFDNILYCVYALVLVGLVVMKIYFSGVITSLNYQSEGLKNEIELVEKVNESNSMKINELVSVEFVREVARENGFQTYASNIKSLD